MSIFSSVIGLTKLISDSKPTHQQITFKQISVNQLLKILLNQI